MFVCTLTSPNNIFTHLVLYYIPPYLYQHIHTSSPTLVKKNASLIFNVILELVGHQECKDDQNGERTLLMCYSLCFDSELNAAVLS